jgi:hypothetical protein
MLFFIAGLLAVERTTSLLHKDRESHPLFIAESYSNPVGLSTTKTTGTDANY